MTEEAEYIQKLRNEIQGLEKQWETERKGLLEMMVKKEEILEIRERSIIEREQALKGREKELLERDKMLEEKKDRLMELAAKLDVQTD